MSTSNLINLIKRISVEAVKNSSPSDFIIGTVVSITPLKIKISDKMILEEVHFYKLKSAMGNFKVTVNGNDGVCFHTLNLNDRVLLGRCQGGEKFVVLGELIE